MKRDLKSSDWLRTSILIFFFVLVPHVLLFSQSVVKGFVKDSVSGAPIEFATVRIDGTSIGGLTDENGWFTFSNTSSGRKTLVVSLMGYAEKRISILGGQVVNLDIKLQEAGVKLKEVVVRPKKEKYSKKDNPAVALIKKVIAHKYDNQIESQDYYMNDEYERLMFAMNDYKQGKGLLKGMKFLENYTDTSKIGGKTILPFSVRETISNVYYRKNPKDIRRVVTGHKTEGVDQAMDAELLDGIINSLFQDIDIRENMTTMLFNDFVSPLSNIAAVSFYKWYIIDTVKIDNKPYVNLGFVPFNTRDVGFIGNIYVQPDSSYTIKRISFRVPSKINVNYLDDMLVTQDFKELSPDLWVPEKITTAMDLSIYGIGKVYVEKVRDFSNFSFNLPVEAVFKNEAKTIFLADYKKRDPKFWETERPKGLEDMKMARMMEDLQKTKWINIALKAANIMSSNYVATNSDENKNKLDLGTTLTFYSYNHLEGHRFRLTGSTTKHFHPHLYLYGYAAYGTRDHKSKYYGEATWAFNKRDYHKDEFPRNNLSIAYKYDVNTLGQRYLQAERDNILLSIGAKSYDNLTYSRMSEISYLHEYHNGFSFGLWGKNVQEEAAGNLRLEYRDENGIITQSRHLKATEAGFFIRKAFKEKFFQQRRKRRQLSSDGMVWNFIYAKNLKNVLGGQYNYQYLALSLDKEFWIAPYGRIGFTVGGRKILGKAPFLFLLSENANSSLTIQRGSYYMLKPLEFLNDSQVSWDISYRLNGWLFNRIPLFRALKIREVLGFRGFMGSLSRKNDPDYDHSLMAFPEYTYRMGNKPYMEYSVGVQNILQFFRVDYVHRLTYLDHPGIQKHGFRISFDINF